eukprot:COSAG01_NODE_2531_length_7495_cov_6.504191_2_plen_37_part_00
MPQHCQQAHTESMGHIHDPVVADLQQDKTAEEAHSG